MRFLIGALLCLLCMSPAKSTPLDDLFDALKTNDVVAVRNLLAKGMEPNSSDKEGYSLLMYAAREGQLDMMEMLLQKGAKVNARNFVGETAIMLAAYRGHLESVKLLYRHAARLDQPGWAPIHYAAIEGKTEVLRFLLDQGAMIDAPAPNGATALMLTARGGHIAALKLLLERGANPALRTDSGGSALDWAEAANHTEAANLLRQKINK